MKGVEIYMSLKRKSTKSQEPKLKVINKPIFITNSEEDIILQSGCRFNKDIKLTEFSGTIQCPRGIFFYGHLIFHKCECHIICEEEPNIFGKVILEKSTVSMEGVPENYSEQLSDDVLILKQSKLYT